MSRTETHYLLNTIMLDDYCVFIQRMNEEKIAELAKEFASCCSINKDEAGLGLSELEDSAVSLIGGAYVCPYACIFCMVH